MKKIQVSVLVLATAISMGSCSKSSVNPDSASTLSSDNASIAANGSSLDRGKGGQKPTGTSIDVSTLPAAITSYITANYAGYTTSSAHTETNGNYDVTVVNSAGTPTRLVFTSAGVFVSATAMSSPKTANTTTNVPLASLPAAITSYITANYAGATTNSAHTESSTGYYDVTITTAANVVTKLYFDANGVFVSANTKTNGTTTKVETAIDITTLSSTITSYMNSNYVGSTITSAHTESNGDIDVLFTTSAGVASRATFTNAGVFVSVNTQGTKPASGSSSSSDIAVSALPAAITTYISTTYPGSTIKEADLMSNGNYSVKVVTAANIKTSLNFTSTGTLISASFHR